jgi:hypothetical protein
MREYNFEFSMVEGISASEEYQEFEKRNNRFINMLADNVSALNSLSRIGTFAGKAWRG